MTVKFDKDAWILSAIAAGYLIVYEDGTIWRLTYADKEGKNLSRTARPVVYSTHKKSGRVYFNMTWKGITKSVLVNRVVGLKFLPNPNNLPQINHVDGEKQHNYLRQPTPELIAKWGEFQLEWSSGADNEKHAHRTGLKTGRGTSNSNSKLSPAQVLAIRGSQDTPDQLAAAHGVARSTIVNVLNRTTWTHL